MLARVGKTVYPTNRRIRTQGARGAMVRSIERVGARGKNRIWDLLRGTVESPAQVILGVTVPAGKAWAAVTQHGSDSSRRCAGLEEFSRYPFVGDAPVGARIALPDAQPV
jgi:hypothetical protein